MATSEAPIGLIAAVFNDPGERLYITVKGYMYELVFDQQVGLWVFFGECDAGDMDGDRLRFDAAYAYPAGLSNRVKEAAEFARAYYEIKIDDRVGVDAFSRWDPKRERPH